MNQIFQVVPRKWRGIGEIPHSGLGLRPEFASFDAENRFGVAQMLPDEASECQSGLVLRGKIKPAECPAFGLRCNPEHPLGATMVSSEGACAAYFRYRRQPGS
jgi:hydrogenase expression/formation protein HypD